MACRTQLLIRRPHVREEETFLRDLYNVALIQAALGQTRQAFEWLEKPYVNWTERLRMLRFDPRMDSLKEDPRFMAVFQSSILPTQI